ncbi:class B sortase [Butyrivibrio sp. FCS014]|uniref:class B sortase n=1 Tax=Butyrivibrio sp. FCS014 TaxID=1408304 RepID=UPI000466B9B5|nr:class B sortase [Butyrivibrio sp. FCS014]
MKKRIVSLFIASILFLSNIGFASFDSTTAFALEPIGDESDKGEKDEDAVDEEDFEYDSEETYSVEEPADVKIVGFGELPEDVVYQEVKAGTAIEDIEFPDTLRIDVVPDPDREERLIRQLGEERKARKKQTEEEEDDASSLLSSDEEDLEDEEDEAGESALDADGEEVIFFDSETGESSVGVIDKKDDTQEPDYREEEPEQPNPQEEPGTQIDETSGGSSDEVLIIDEPEPEPEPEQEDAADTGSGEATEEASDPVETPAATDDAAPAGDLIGMIKSVFGKLTVYAAEDTEAADDSKPTEDSAGKESSSDETVIDKNDFQDEDGVSHEMVSDVRWIVDYNLSGTDTYDPELIGKEYVFTPILILPDFYYVEADLPTITVKILEEKFAFDETVEVDGVKIRVRADKGVFPEGARIQAEKLEEEEEQKVEEAVSQQSEDQGFVVKSYSFDIQILNSDGEEIEPDIEKGRVIVSFETEEAEDEELKAEVYHIKDSEQEEEKDPAAEAEGSDEWVVEKLQTAVVDGEEGKAVEALTDGFSIYTLTFSCTEFDINWDNDKSYVCLDDALAQNQRLVGSLVIADPDSDIVYNDPEDSKFFYLKRLESSVSTDADNNTVHDPVTSNGSYVEISDAGATNAAWYIIFRKPFRGQTKSLQVTCDRDGTVGTITINITQNGTVDAAFLHEYPYGIDPATMVGTSVPDFALVVDTVSANLTDEGVLYQWQYKKSNGGDWVNIDLAHTSMFGGVFAGAPYAAGDWFRCLLNGEPSREVQIITANADTGRIWTGAYNDDNDRCYVSNGTVAYTVDIASGKTVVDVVGQFSKDGRAYMLRTSLNGRGWSIITDSNAAPTSGDFITGTTDLDELFFYFSDDAPQELYVEADLSSSARALAVGAHCTVGNGEIRDNVPILGTLIGSLNSNKNITKVSFIGIGSRDEAQTAMNNDQGVNYPAVSLVPITTHGLRVWINSNGEPQPYKFAAGSTTVKVDSQEYSNVKILSEKKRSAEAVSWLDAEPDSVVEFKFEIGSLATATSFKNVKDAKSEYTASATNIKGGRLIGNELKQYAITVAGPTDSVLETMRFRSPSSVSSLLSTKIKNYTSGSTSSAQSYKADYLDISIYQTSDNASYNNVSVKEVRRNSKDSGSAAMPLKMELTYDFTNKDQIKILREHNGYVEELTENNNGADGTYTLDRNAGKIYVYSYKFSQYAVAYRQDVYYTVTFDDGTNKNAVKVKAGEKVSKPSDPTKEGYVFKGWYLRGTLGSTTTSVTSTTASLYNFDNAITKDITLVAGWSSVKDEENKKSNTGDDDENGSRAPKMGDNLPIVWLWVIVLATGTVTFALTLRELVNANKPEGERKPISGLKKAILLLGILISATAKFVVRKIKENKTKALLTASGAVVVISAVILATTVLQYKTAEDLYVGAEEIYVEESQEEQPVPVERNQEETVVDGHDWWDCVDVNVGKLSEEYPDVVGWLYFENEDISYPIMYSGDNAKYLSTAYTGEKAKAGAIFIDGESTPDFSDPHSLVYGHNMRDLSMFGKLRYYRNEPGYYEDHQYFQVFTKDSVYRYRIFACEVVPDNHDVFWVYGKEPVDYYRMLKKVEQNSFINTGIEANESDHVITLATCTNNDEERFIVCAVRTDSYQYQQ